MLCKLVKNFVRPQNSRQRIGEGCFPQCDLDFSPAFPQSFTSSTMCLWLPSLSVHTGLCQSVVHDAKGSHPPWESVLLGAGARLARIPNGHLGKLLLHDGQVYLQAVTDIKESTWISGSEWKIPFFCLLSTSDITGVKTRQPDGVLSLSNQIKRRKMNKWDWQERQQQIFTLPHTNQPANLPF